MAFRILVSDPIAQEGLEVLKEGAIVDVRPGLSKEDLYRVIAEYDALIVRSETKVTAELIEVAPRLQVVGRAGVGVDNIDVEAATRRGIIVINSPTGNNIAACEHTMALMLSLARNIPQANASLKAGQWKRSQFVGVELAGKTLGIIGIGKIGTEVARRAQAFRMRTIAYDPYASQHHAANINTELVSMEELLRTSDFVTIHTPLNASTKGLIGAPELELMKPTARIINCARGGLVEEHALVAALDAGRLAGAALDVFDQEPPVYRDLIEHPKVITTPHLGASTVEAQINVAVDVAQEVLHALEGTPVRNAINAPIISAESQMVLQPYISLADMLARIYVQMLEGRLGNEVIITYSGDIASYDTTLLRTAIIRGLLERTTSNYINMVNAGLVARQRGLNINEQHRSNGEHTYTGTMTLEVRGSEGISEIGGTVVHQEPHVISINGYHVHFVPQGDYLLIGKHHDQPGMIGKIGTILGNANVNISFMEVGRQAPRGEAVVVLGIDEPITHDLLQQLRCIPGIGMLKMVRLT